MQRCLKARAVQEPVDCHGLGTLVLHLPGWARCANASAAFAFSCALYGGMAKCSAHWRREGSGGMRTSEDPNRGPTQENLYANLFGFPY